MSITYELFFQIFNTILWILIPIAIYGFIKNHRRSKQLTESRISDLEKKVKDLDR